MNLYDMLQERARIYEQMKALQDKYLDKPMEGPDGDTYGNLEGEFDKLTARIEAKKRQDERDRLMGETKAPQQPQSEKSLFVKALTGDVDSLRELRQVKNGMQLGNDGQAGSLTAPMEFRDELIKGLDDILWMRQISRNVGSIGAAQSLGYPYRKTEAADAEWEGEVDEAAEETTLAYGRREFKPNRMAKLIKVSTTLVSHAPNAEGVILEEMRYRVGITQEKAYMTGNGTGKPLGIFTASDSGIPTSRDVADGNTATGVTFDGLINAKYSLKEQYLRGASWIIHRDLAKMLAKLKDGESRYIWQPAVALGQPDMLLGHPVHMSEYAPNTYTTGLYAAVFGDFRYYWIVDADQLLVKVLNELYATSNQIGYLLHYFGDGAPVLGEAFARVKLGAA